MTRPGPVLRYTLIGFAGLAVGAVLLLGFGAEETEDSFSWTIQPPLSAAALGAFYGSAFFLFIAGIRAPAAVTVRQIAPPVFLIATTLLAVTLIHLDRFDMDSVFGPFWLTAYIVAPPLILWGIWLDREAFGGPVPGASLPDWLRGVLYFQGVAMVSVGALLLEDPARAADVWPWELTPLVGRALGAFCLGVGVVAVLVANAGVLGSRWIAVAYAALGGLQLLALGLHEGDLGSSDSATIVYVAFLASILLAGLYGLFSSARALSR